MTKLLTTRELANRLQVRSEYVYKLVQEGRIPVIRVGRKYRFDADAVVAALKMDNPANERRRHDQAQ